MELPIFSSPFGIARDQDFVETRGRARGFHGVADELHALDEFVERHETRDVDGDKGLARVHADVLDADASDVGEHRAAGQYGAQNFDHDREAGSFISAERHGKAVERGLRIRGRIAVGVHGPAGGDGFVAAEDSLVDAIERDGGGRHIQQEAVGAGNGHADRVGAEHLLAALPGGDQRSGIAHDDAEQIFARELLRPPRRCAEVRRIARDHQADAVVPREAHGVIATGVGDELADGVVAVVDHAGSVLAGDVAGAMDVDVAGGDLFGVPDEELDAMRIDTAQIGGNQSFRDQRGGQGRNAGSFQDGARKRSERSGRDDHEIARHADRLAFAHAGRVDYNKDTRLGRVAQLVRAPASHAGGHRFESCRAHHSAR